MALAFPRALETLGRLHISMYVLVTSIWSYFLTSTIITITVAPTGHAFLLVYINLFILEEAKTIDGWEGIRDKIRLEDHNRGDAQNDPGESKTPLEGLTPYDMAILKVGLP